MAQGVENFCEGLRALGYDPVPLGAAYPDHVTFEFEVPCGTYIGKRVKLGFHVPIGFPMSAPSGPHHTPILLSDDGSGQPPRGGFHLNYDPAFNAVTGENWQYWSRPYLGWSAPPQPVRAYLAFIKQLWSLL